MFSFAAFGALMLAAGSMASPNPNISVGTLNLYHYPVHYQERVDSIHREQGTAGFPEIMGFQEAANWPKYESLYEVIAKSSNFLVKRETGNDLKFFSDGVAIAASTEPLTYRGLNLPADSKWSHQVAQIALFRTALGPLYFVNIHTSPGPLKEKARLQQVQFVAEAISHLETGVPVIWVGDFNDDPTSPALRFLHEAGWRDALNDQELTYVHPENPLTLYPVRRRLDYILYKPAELKVISAQVRFKDNRISDHYGLSAVFEKSTSP